MTQSKIPDFLISKSAEHLVDPDSVVTADEPLPADDLRKGKRALPASVTLGSLTFVGFVYDIAVANKLWSINVEMPTNEVLELFKSLAGDDVVATEITIRRDVGSPVELIRSGTDHVWKVTSVKTLQIRDRKSLVQVVLQTT